MVVVALIQIRERSYLSHGDKSAAMEVTLVNSNLPKPVFIAPILKPVDEFGNGGKPETLTFELTVEDGHGGTASGVIHVTVIGANCPPGTVGRNCYRK